MDTINIKFKPKKDHGYPIYIGNGIINNCVDILSKHYTGKQLVVISDNNVAQLYLDRLKNILESAGYAVLTLVIKAGESSKTSRTKEKLEQAMFNGKINRGALIIAFGGGVVGDMAGYLASTYMRGVRYIQIPTSLLAMLDSSVGGKTGINTKYGKNLIGTYYQPLSVMVDISLLASLPKKHLINGIIEAIKIFLTFDKESFEFVSGNIEQLFLLNQDFLLKVIKRALELKVYVIEHDEQEENLRMALNFGHTIGHALELVRQYKILHGFAVGVGIIIESLIATKLGKLSNCEAIKIESLLNRLSISRQLINKYDIQAIAHATVLDKKNAEHQLDSAKCVLLQQIGKIAPANNGMVATNVNFRTILEVLETCVISRCTQ